MKKILSIVLITAGLIAPTLFTTAQAGIYTSAGTGNNTGDESKKESIINRVLYDCGQGFLQSESCSDNDNNRAVFKKELWMSGYDKTYRCSNGWQVTHPSYCPDSGKNNIGLG